jgi:hypothetical protein
MSTGHSCSFVYADQSRRISLFSGAAFTPIATTTGSAVAVPGTHHVRFRIDATTSVCSFDPGGTMMLSLTPERTFVGIRARNLSAAFHYIAVYRSP